MLLRLLQFYRLRTLCHQQLGSVARCTKLIISEWASYYYLMPNRLTDTTKSQLYFKFHTSIAASHRPPMVSSVWFNCICRVWEKWFRSSFILLWMWLIARRRKLKQLDSVKLSYNQTIDNCFIIVNPCLVWRRLPFTSSLKESGLHKVHRYIFNYCGWLCLTNGKQID